VIEYLGKAKYLGVMLVAYKSFTVDTKFMKSKFYKAFNGIYHRVCKLKNELVSVQMMNSFRKPYLLYATECLGLTVTQMRIVSVIRGSVQYRMFLILLVNL